LTAAMSDSERVAVCFFGDGGANQGTFHEALNLAAIWKLPVVYVCENNQYAESLPSSRAFAVKEISRRADGYGMPGVEVDGCDVRDVFASAGEAIDRARRGEGPTLIVATAFRQEGHYYGDPQRYRPAGEAERWRKDFDPLTIASEWLVADGIATAGELANLDEEIDSEIQRAVEWAEASPEASPIRLEEIYASY
jgi:TPP-dependent pyruvate/acetoin dehydrogenase alpha subunit